MQQREPVTTEKLPPEASRSGKNAYYVPCEVVHSRPNYGVCLFVIKAYDEDRLNGSYADCARAIHGGYCEARKAQQEEQKAGRALYYKEREIPTVKIADDTPPEQQPLEKVDKNSASYIRGWNSVTGNKAKPLGHKAAVPNKRKPIKQKSVTPTDELSKGMEAAGSMTDAVNDAAADAQKAVNAVEDTQKKESASQSVLERRNRAKEVARKMMQMKKKG